MPVGASASSATSRFASRLKRMISRTMRRYDGLSRFAGWASRPSALARYSNEPPPIDAENDMSLGSVATPRASKSRTRFG